MGRVYKPLRNWVDEFIPYYMEMSWELIDPGTYAKATHTHTQILNIFATHLISMGSSVNPESGIRGMSC